MLSHVRGPKGVSALSELKRFGVAMDVSLLAAFDELIARSGYQNRSEAIRDLVRDHLVESQWRDPQAPVIGTITLVYDHHASDIEHRLTHLQHEHPEHICASTHVHLDHNNCLEVIVVRGPSDMIRDLAGQLIASRGVKHGKLVCTTSGAGLH